eukprot:COSAG01_NODE_10632_length_2116_cov_2.955379_1_plen_60_part_10
MWAPGRLRPQSTLYFQRNIHASLSAVVEGGGGRERERREQSHRVPTVLPGAAAAAELSSA